MKYDSSIVGEKVINAAGKKGTIMSVSRDGELNAKSSELARLSKCNTD